MGGQHVLQQGGARAGEADQEDMHRRIGCAGTGFGRLSPRPGIGRSEPCGQPLGAGQGALPAGRLEPGGVQPLHLSIRRQIGGERLGGTTGRVVEIADQAQHDGAIGGSQLLIALQIVQPA